MWDTVKRSKLADVKWRGLDSELNADVYSLCCSKKKEDFFVAGSITTGELEVFEKNNIYTPTWTVSDVHGGILSLDLSPRDDRLAFTTGDKRVHILNIGKII